MNQRVKNFILYETARLSGRWNMITEASEVAKHLNMPIKTYQNVQLNYSDLKDEAEKYREENKEEYDSVFTIESALREEPPF